MLNSLFESARIMKSKRAACVLWIAGVAASCAVAQQASPSLHEDGKKFSGLGVILRMETAGAEPVVQADGYRIRIGAGAETSFHGGLKALTDVGPNTWIRFEGKRDGTVIAATNAEFYPAGSRRWLSAMGPRKVKPAPDYQPIVKDSLVDADGHIENPQKVRYSDAGGYCGWHFVPADQALQERVERVGMALVPAYQRALAATEPSRIPFRFYAVADDRIRTVFACNSGLVLVPKNVVERLKSDDQLAAVLADGVAYHLQRQLVTVPPSELVLTAAEAVPLVQVFAGGEVIGGVLRYEEWLKLQREVLRIALQLLADAGYDPWQAPEAWRLLEPKDPPNEVSSLKYTREGIYQLAILRWQYKSEWKAGDADPAAPATPDSEAQQP